MDSSDVSLRALQRFCFVRKRERREKRGMEGGRQERRGVDEMELALAC